jgi:hypothetical protein
MKINYLSKDSKKGFNLLAGINRPITPSQVSKMAESIQYFDGILRPVIVCKVNFLDGIEKTYIVDGQHLYMACMRLKIDIPYLEIEVKDHKDLVEKIALLNATSKNWTLDDYINTWSYYKKEYKEYRYLLGLYNIEKTILAELLHTGIVRANDSRGNNGMSKTIKKGELRIVNKELAIKVLDYVTDLRSVTKDLGRQEQKLLISVMIEKIKADGGEYNHNKYKKYLQSIQSKLLLASNDTDKIRELLNK